MHQHMTSKVSVRKSIPTLAVLLVLGAGGCGGGGGGDGTMAPTPATPVTPDADTEVVSKGVVTGFGSVWVNDERYELDGDTRVRVDDDDERFGDDGALRLGMKVEITARERDQRRLARSIAYRRDLKGPVTRVVLDADDASIGSFRVADTLVIVNGETLFDRSIGDNDGNGVIDIRDLLLEHGRMVVSVSGLAGETGYLATWVTRQSRDHDDDDEIEIKGFVQAVDLAASTLTVSGTTFIVTSRTEFDDGLSFGEGLVGEFVEVEARITADGFEATEVEREDDGRRDRRGRLEIEGILISVDTSVSPNVVQIGSRTREVDDASSLVGLVGAKVQLKGSFDANGVLVLDRVRVRGGDVELEDRVTSVDLAAGTFTTRLGLVIRPEPTSRLKDDDDDDHRLSPEQFLNRLRSNDEIEARGFVDGDGNVIWTRIEREDDDDDFGCELQGPVEAIAADQTSFRILGVTIDVSSGRDVEFEDENDERISRAGFFSRLQVGDIVSAESDDDDVNGCQNGLMLAEEVEIERTGSGVVPVMPPVNGGGEDGASDGDGPVVFLVIDEDSIDNGNPPSDFSETDVNDDIAEVGQRQPLRYFQANIGTTIDLFTGQVGDEGWFALKTIPSSWRSAGPTGNGLRNYLLAGPGLGTGDDPEVLLDEIPDVTPLRATGLAMLIGETICAIVYDSDVSINYSPLEGNLQGANLGTVAFDVLRVAERTDGSSSDLPRVGIRIRDAALCDEPLVLFSNAPVPSSSSEPFDIAPPASPPAAQLSPAP
jgi:hypothetical protein